METMNGLARHPVNKSLLAGVEIGTACSLRLVLLFGFVIWLSTAGGCSVKRYAVNTVGDLLASGDSIYESDNDIALVGEALPFSLKLVESLLAESPNHRGLLLAATRGFVLYSYAYVHFQAERWAVSTPFASA